MEPRPRSVSRVFADVRGKAGFVGPGGGMLRRSDPPSSFCLKFNRRASICSLPTRPGCLTRHVQTATILLARFGEIDEAAQDRGEGRKKAARQAPETQCAEVRALCHGYFRGAHDRAAHP